MSEVVSDHYTQGVRLGEQPCVWCGCHCVDEFKCGCGMVHDIVCANCSCTPTTIGRVGDLPLAEHPLAEGLTRCDRGAVLHVHEHPMPAAPPWPPKRRGSYELVTFTP